MSRESTNFAVYRNYQIGSFNGHQYVTGGKYNNPYTYATPAFNQVRRFQI